MRLENKIQTVADWMESPLAVFISIAANYCGYEVTTNQLIINWVHPLFLNDHFESRKEDNTNWNQAMHVPFYDEYWQAACTELENLECMGAWNVVDCE